MTKTREAKLQKEIEKLQEQLAVEDIKPIHVQSPVEELAQDKQSMWLSDARIKTSIVNLMALAPRSKQLNKRKITAGVRKVKAAVEDHLRKYAGTGWGVTDITLFGKDDIKEDTRDCVHIEITHPALVYNRSGINVSINKETLEYMSWTNVYRYQVM